MKKRYIFLLFLAMNNFNAQKKGTIPIINDKPEKFDTEIFSKEVKKNRKDKIYITNRDDVFIVNDQVGNTLIDYSKSYNLGTFSGNDYSLNPLFGVQRDFYKNNVLKTKGVFCWFGFRMGKWYHYDDQGKLISIEDCDQGFNFNYKMIFDYCKRNNIPLERKESGYRTSIFKSFSSEKNTFLWEIIYYGISDIDYTKKVEKSVLMDGQNGTVINKSERPLPVGG